MGAMRMTPHVGTPRTHNEDGGFSMMREVQSPAREMIMEYCPGLSGSEMVAKECHSRRGEVLNRTKEPGTGVTIGVSV